MTQLEHLRMSITKKMPSTSWKVKKLACGIVITYSHSYTIASSKYVYSRNLSTQVHEKQKWHEFSTYIKQRRS